MTWVILLFIEMTRFLFLSGLDTLVSLVVFLKNHDLSARQSEADCQALNSGRCDRTREREKEQNAPVHFFAAQAALRRL